MKNFTMKINLLQQFYRKLHKVNTDVDEQPNIYVRIIRSFCIYARVVLPEQILIKMLIHFNSNYSIVSN